MPLALHEENTLGIPCATLRLLQFGDERLRKLHHLLGLAHRVRNTNGARHVLVAVAEKAHERHGL